MSVINTKLDIATDIRDCIYLNTQPVNGGKMMIYLIPEIAAIDCSSCDEFAEYYIYITATDPSQDIHACLCIEHFDLLSRLKQLAVPVQVLH